MASSLMFLSSASSSALLRITDIMLSPSKGSRSHHIPRAWHVAVGG
jgi:hypothetical protein